MREETTSSYLDVEARRVIVIEKENMHSYYAKNLLVTYRLTSRKTYEKLFLMIGFFMAFYALIIMLFRFKTQLK